MQPAIDRAPDAFAMPAGDLLAPGGLYAAARCSDVLLDVSCGNAYPNIYGARRFVIIVIAKLAVLLVRVTSCLVVYLGGSTAVSERAVRSAVSRASGWAGRRRSAEILIRQG